MDKLLRYIALHEYGALFFHCLFTAGFFIGVYVMILIARKRRIVICRDYGDAIFPMAAGCVFVICVSVLEALKYFGAVSAPEKDMAISLCGFMVFVLLIPYNFYAARSYYKNDCKRILFVFLARGVFVTPLALLLFYISFTTLKKMLWFILFPSGEGFGFIYIKFILSSFIFALVFIVLRFLAGILFDFAFVGKFSNPFKYVLPSKLKAVGKEINSRTIFLKNKEKS